MLSVTKQATARRVVGRGLGITCAALLTAAPALAGAGSSGGAFQLRDTLNPWFLQNTAKISYCIDLEPAAFSVSHADARARIEAAYRYWQQEFAEAYAWPYQGMTPQQFQIATQVLQEVACEDQVDLRFQLGKLTPAQMAAIDQPSDTIAVTVRTAYDRVRMHGQGFIYVAGDQGQAGRAPRVADGIWSAAQGSLLTNALAHELGHVFGIPDSGYGWRLMTYDYVAKLLAAQERWSPQDSSQDIPETVAAKVGPWPFAWGWHEADGDRRTSLWAAKIFGSAAAPFGNIKCSYANDHLNFAELGSDGRTWLPLGTAELTGTWQPGETLVNVWLPPERNVFKFRGPLSGTPVEQPAQTAPIPAVADKIRHLQGFYVAPRSGVRTTLNFDVSPREWPPRVAAYADGKLYMNLFTAATSLDPEQHGAP